jgi:hypothetical protein
MYALEHNTDNRKVTLLGILPHNRDSPSRTKQQILELAPANCKGFMVHFTLTGGSDHYSAWRLAESLV